MTRVLPLVKFSLLISVAVIDIFVEGVGLDVGLLVYWVVGLFVGGLVGKLFAGDVGEGELFGVKRPLFWATMAKAAMLNAKLRATMTQRNTVKGFITSKGVRRFYIVYLKTLQGLAAIRWSVGHNNPANPPTKKL